MIILKLEGIDKIEEAEKYKGLYIKIKKEDRIKLSKDSYYISDIINFEIYNEVGEKLGFLEDIFSTKSNDVYVLKNFEGKQILLPGIKSVIKKVDLVNKKIIINLIKGLI